MSYNNSYASSVNVGDAATISGDTSGSLSTVKYHEVFKEGNYSGGLSACTMSEGGTGSKCTVDCSCNGDNGWKASSAGMTNPITVTSNRTYYNGNSSAAKVTCYKENPTCPNGEYYSTTEPTLNYMMPMEDRFNPNCWYLYKCCKTATCNSSSESWYELESLKDMQDAEYREGYGYEAGIKPVYEFGGRGCYDTCYYHGYYTWYDEDDGPKELVRSDAGTYMNCKPKPYYAKIEIITMGIGNGIRYRCSTDAPNLGFSVSYMARHPYCNKAIGGYRQTYNMTLTCNGNTQFERENNVVSTIACEPEYDRKGDFEVYDFEITAGSCEGKTGSGTCTALDGKPIDLTVLLNQ